MASSGVKVAAPRSPAVVEISSVEDLLPIVRTIVQRQGYQMLEGLNVKPGMKVLMVTDTTNDPLVVEAFRIAIREAGGLLESIELVGYPEMTEPVELVDAMFSNRWWPAWVWSATESADLMLHMAMLKVPHTPNLPVSHDRSRIVDLECSNRDQLTPEYHTFPRELRDTIDRKVWEVLGYAQRIEVTDAEGTELRCSVSKEEWQREVAKQEKRGGLPYQSGHLQVPLPSTNLEGVLATSSLTFGGPVPRTFCTVQGGQVAAVEGGGKFGEALRKDTEQYRDLRFSGYPGPGVNWLSTMGICTHPKARRSIYYDELTGSARVHAWAIGHRRSGVIHSSIGEGLVREDYKVIRHVDLYFGTLAADGKKVIEGGHLLALDDPEVRAVAQRHGDPDKLLHVDWVPAVAGVNSP